VSLGTFPSRIEQKYTRLETTRIHQGDILRDLTLLEVSRKPRGEATETSLPYSVVLTQDCDLEQDFLNRGESGSMNHDKYLQTILLCPAYPAKDFRDGQHLVGLGLRMEKWNSDRFKLIRSQQNERFHFIDRQEDVNVPELVVDFKHYFTQPRDELYLTLQAAYLATISELFRESLSQRFCYYLGRIGLPDIPTLLPPGQPPNPPNATS